MLKKRRFAVFSFPAEVTAQHAQRVLKHLQILYLTLGPYIIDTKKNGLCFEAVRNQVQSNPGDCIHEPRVIRFCIRTDKIKRIERFSGNSGEKMPVQETDGMYRFQSQYGKHQQKQDICGWCGKSFKISRKILIKSSN